MDRPELERLLREAKAAVDAMPPAEREAMYEAQRQSWVRGEMALSAAERETTSMIRPADIAARYPEHAKLHKIQPLSQAVGEFLEWCGAPERRWMLAEHCRGELVPVSKSLEATLSEFFGIDRDRLEDEKREMLERLRELNDGR